MYRKWAGISEAIWLLGIAELPKKIDNVHCSGWMRVAGRIVIPCRHKKTTVCSLVCNSSYPIRSFSWEKCCDEHTGKLSITSSPWATPKAYSAKTAKSRTGQRMPMMELKPAPMYFKEVVFLRNDQREGLVFFIFLCHFGKSTEKKYCRKLPGSTNDGYFFDHKSPQFHFTLKGKKTVGNAVFV